MDDFGHHLEVGFLYIKTMKILETIFIILLVLAGIFWFFIRPALVRQNCSTWASQSDYEWCLRNSGIEP